MAFTENHTLYTATAQFLSGGGRELFLAPLFLLNYFLFNLFLFSQKELGGGDKAPQSLPLRGPCFK